MRAVPFHRHDDLLAEFPRKAGTGGSGHHEHDGIQRHFHYVSGDRIDWRDEAGDHSTGWWGPGRPIGDNTLEPPA